MGGRSGRFAGRSHRGKEFSAGISPSQIRQEQQPNPEPPRWFTARRKLVKFKSAFKTGLARCPAPSLQQVLPTRDTARPRQEFIALTFLGSFGWISLLSPFPPTAPPEPSSFLRVRSSCRSSVRLSTRSSIYPYFSRRENFSSRLGTKSSR